MEAQNAWRFPIACSRAHLAAAVTFEASVRHLPLLILWRSASTQTYVHVRFREADVGDFEPLLRVPAVASIGEWIKSGWQRLNAAMPETATAWTPWFLQNSRQGKPSGPADDQVEQSIFPTT